MPRVTTSATSLQSVVFASTVAVSLSLDNFAVGFAFSLTNRRLISWESNAIISAMNAGGQLGASYIGQKLAGIMLFGSVVPGMLFIWLGLDEIRRARAKLPERSTSGKYMPQETDGIEEILGLGLALSLSNVAGGMASGMSSDASLDLLVLTAFLASFILMQLGGMAAASASGFVGSRLEGIFPVVGGTVFVLLGTWQLAEVLM